MARNKTRRPVPPTEAAARPALKPPVEVIKQEFARVLMATLIDRGKTQADLSRDTKIGRDSISKYINAKTFPDPLNLKKIADALKIDPKVLAPYAWGEAMESEIPALSLKTVQGHPDRAWLQVNQECSLATAAKVIEMLQAENSTKN